MKSLVKYFGLILLIVFTSVWTSNGEDIELQDAMPQEILANSVNHSEYSTAEKTIKYLCLEHIAIPFSAVIELPGNHPHSSKSKTLQTNIQNNRHEVVYRLHNCKIIVNSFYRISRIYLKQRL